MNTNKRGAKSGLKTAKTVEKAAPYHFVFFILLLLFLFGSWNVCRAELLPLELDQDFTLFNFQSQFGVPISTTANVPPGSDGQLPTVDQSSGLNTPATANQFQSFLSFGGAPGLTFDGWNNLTNYADLQAGSAPFSGNVAAEMGLPVGRNPAPNNSVVMVLRRAQVGAPYLSQQISFLFGSQIAPPDTDETGLLLTNVLNTAYWLPQPYFTTNDTDVSQGYYWSPNANAVFAIQSGPITITWIKAAAYTLSTVPAYTNVNGLLNSTPNFLTNGGSVYELYTANYLVSSSPAKTPQKMYWTEPPFDKTGHLVDVPAANVDAVNVVYNRAFPQYATNLYNDPYVTPQTDPTNSLQEPRTLWYDPNTKTIHSYNIEGRVFVELLGELNSDGVTRRFLGDEIVDVYKEPTPSDVTVELGERVPAYQDGRDDSNLFPSPVSGTDSKFYYQQTSADGSQATLYATYETANLSDFQAHWLITGVGGLRWPYIFDRYHEVWPDDASKYVHYLRPLVPTEAEAEETAVQLPGSEAPQISYQDPFPSPLGAKLSANGLFYTYLDSAHPAHRTLLQFSVNGQVAFERVFSWLDVGVKSNALFADSVAANLTAWNSTNLSLNFTDPSDTPQVVTGTVNVGDRIQPPAGELGFTNGYWAGYILQTNGNSFNPGAYLDPFKVGFEQANQGAIIPVNAIPGHDTLDVWWFRKDNVNESLGFQPSYWPAVIGHYKVQWPANADEIILASNDGSGPLDSLQAKGTIYRQNDPTLPGYNPNEEHALMLGGQAYALRDDLNLTNAADYSSAPFVLVNYTGSDNRPAMHAFHVRREKPEAGILFDYVADAGSVLQAPMPLPLLAPPVAGSGQYAVNYNIEPPANSGDLPVGWNSSFENSQFARYARFTFEDRKHEFWVYRGQNAGLPALAAGHYDPANKTFDPLPAATAVMNQPFSYYIHVSRRAESLTVTASNLPVGLAVETTNGIAITGIPTVAASGLVTVAIHDAADDSTITNTFLLNVATNTDATIVAQGPLTITATNQYSDTAVTYTDRPPFLAQSPTPTNSFTMRFYYKTQDGFDWPGVANPPPPGSIVPYLREPDGMGGFVGDPASSNTPSLDIVYRPVWPSLVNGNPLPTLDSGETLTVAKNGMAAVRGQSSVQVLYQQSIGLDITDAPASVVLYDPTAQKTASLSAQGLAALPASVVSSPYLGKDYFPNLPPNLVNRVFYDPNTGKLVFQGQFEDDPVGEKYLLLNVLRGADLAAVKGLCPDADTQNKPAWDALVDALSTPVYTFHEDPDVPGSYVNDAAETVTRGAGDLVVVTNSDTQVDSYALGATGPGTGYVTYIVGNGHDPAHAGEPVSMYILRVSPELSPGELKVISDPNPLSELITFQHSEDLAGRSGDYEYDWRIAPPVDGQPPVSDPTNWTSLASGGDITHFTLGGGSGTGIQTLGDNYVSLRYRSINPLANPASTNWSDWTPPELAEGWIKRVVAGINPFNQRTSDLFNNPVNTTASIIAQAGHRWEGDVALNQDSLNNYGLIEIYETVLHRGEALSINAPGGGINYGPANDALLLAAGYLNDLYMMIGNDASADAANPTIGIGTADKTYGDIATSLFSFQGQVPTLLDEELALLRGRDDSLSPGVRLPPVYNRLYWNYTLGIAAGEVIYALNYNILDENNDGVVDAADAAILYPQGHGDAYGHYLTALDNYYSLLLNPNFDWVPRIETVSVLGAAVSVDYQDERKFAAAAAAVARTGEQIFDLTWREDYHPALGSGWSYFGASRENSQEPYADGGQTKYVTRYWGMDHWAARTGQGAYLNWVVGNAILPPVDPDPAHEGIQKVDRTTVPELAELPATETKLQSDMDNAEAGFTPLGISRNSIPFDINPLLVTSANPKTHFEQIYDRAVSTLNNAVVAFNDAQNVTETMRSEQDSLADFQAGYTNQEMAYNSQLIRLYGTPYPDDMGPGKTYPQDYVGPDLLHYMYVDNPDTNDFNGILPDPAASRTFYVDVQDVPTNWTAQMLTDIGLVPSTDPDYTNNSSFSIPFNIGPDGFFGKPADWTSERESPGTIQQAISEVTAAQNKLREVVADETYDKQALDKAMSVFESQIADESNRIAIQNNDADLQKSINDLQEGYNVESKANGDIVAGLDDLRTIASEGVPTTFIFGLADGGDEAKLALVPLYTGIELSKAAVLAADLATYIGTSAQTTVDQNKILSDQQTLANMQLDQDTKNGILALGNQELALQNDLFTINDALRSLNDAQNAYQAQVAEGNRIQQERLTFRQHAAAIIQGYRTRDAAFRLFQNEKLERYKTLFDLAAEYAFLAAQAYDYDTGLINTQQGQDFLNRIISARALGVVENGQPQYAGSDTGDPGLSSALAEMKADWDVLKGRLGFNNPDGYGTTVSLRTENYRILPGSQGDNNWRDVLQRGRMADLLADPDVKRYCMQIDDGSGQPVPGIVLTFSTTIQDGLNLFGQPLAPGDHNFSPSSFATKIFAVGVDFQGYIGMDNPTTGSASGGTTPPDPTLDPDALAATPYIYLIPVGADSMRSPPLGDVGSAIRTWNVEDLAIPLPFNISGSDYSSAPFYTAADSLSEPLFAVRKDQAFRPVSTTDAFTTSIYAGSGGLAPSQFTNQRLIGRSIWNSKWKLVIPGKTLLNDPNDGLNRFIRSVKDIKIYFVTYSYAGN